jgi:predicted kinase
MDTLRRRLRGPTRAYVIAGAPGTGKSALGTQLSRRIGAALLDQDVLTGPLTAVVAELIGAEPGDLGDPRVRSATRTATYDALTGTAAGCLAAGVPTVLVAPFTTERSDPAAWAGFVARLRAPGGVLLVWTTCPAHELARRLAARAAPRDQRKLADLDGFLSSGVLAPPAVPHVAIDTTASAAAQLAAVLGRQPGSVSPDSRAGGPIRHH